MSTTCAVRYLISQNCSVHILLSLLFLRLIFNNSKLTAGCIRYITTGFLLAPHSY